jgi:hypothetical protein
MATSSATATVPVRRTNLSARSCMIRLMPEQLTSTDLDDWSRCRDAEEHLPTLARRLVMATVRADPSVLPPQRASGCPASTDGSKPARFRSQLLVQGTRCTRVPQGGHVEPFERREVFRDAPAPSSRSRSSLSAYCRDGTSVGDGAPSTEELLSWVRTAKRGLAEADRREVASVVTGEAISGPATDADGTWPCRPRRPGGRARRSIERGLAIGRLNQRGATVRSAYDGGDQDACSLPSTRIGHIMSVLPGHAPALCWTSWPAGTWPKHAAKTAGPTAAPTNSRRAAAPPTVSHRKPSTPERTRSQGLQGAEGVLRGILPGYP